MDKDTRREIVRGFYPGPRWADRVEAMSDLEILAVYDAKLEQVRKQGGTDMQLRLKAEER
jgi:hypothetical protein